MENGVKNTLLGPYFANLGAWPWLFAALFVCALIVYGIAMKRRALAAFASDHLLAFLAPNASRGRQIVRLCLITLAALAIGVAMLGPRWGTYYEEAHTRHLDLIICLDTSRSMLAEDAGMSRLDRARDDINQLLDRIGGASVGLVAFAGKAELTCPLTDDYEYLRLVLKDVDTFSAPVGGTNIGSAIETARRALGPPRQTGERAIFLISDGEDHGGTAVDEARRALQEEIPVYTIGVGQESQTGAPIPLHAIGQSSYLVHEEKQVRTKLQPANLAAIAAAGGGEYHPSGQVTNRERTLEWLYANKLSPRLKEGLSDQQVEQRYHRSHWFATAALVLLMFESLISERRSTPRPSGLTVGVQE